MIAYDLDGALPLGTYPPKGSVVITGRTFSEWDDRVRDMAMHAPVYVRGVGKVGDREHAALFKAEVITLLGITVFYEDDEEQVQIIAEHCPWVEIRRPA